ncbi:MAG: tRNA lysidine(34) synthetase TilS, partial [bacterium]|nr:tRNA lysidine(34) synthetase TilS [bacterium]
MLDRVLKQIRKNRLIEPGQRLLVALSGGPDSVALLRLLCSIKEEWRLKVAAVHINHLIREGASDADESFCRNLCENWEVELISDRADIPALAAKWKMSVEQAARKYRYQLFERLATDEGFDRVLLGHHADDQAETVLFRLIRGSGRTGLVGMSPKRSIYVRPLLQQSKADILEYLRANELDFCIDESNSDISYRRNFIRQKLIPLIEENLNPSVRELLAETADTFSSEEVYLAAIARSAIEKAVLKRRSGTLEIDRAELRKMDIWLQRRVLRYCLAELQEGEFFPDKRTVERLVERAAQSMLGPTELRLRAVPNEIPIGVPTEVQLKLKNASI